MSQQQQEKQEKQEKQEQQEQQEQDEYQNEIMNKLKTDILNTHKKIKMYRRGACAPPLTPSVKGGGSVAPYIPHLFICINLLLLQAAIAHVAHSPVGAKGTYGAKRTYGSPLTSPLKEGVVSPRSNPTRVAANFQFN
jgi:hypothetical protein